VYFVLALWLFRGRNSGYGQVMAKLADGLYHRRRGADLMAGRLDPDGWVDAGAGRRWRQPGASSLSRARDKLDADPLHMLFDHVAGPVAAGGAPGVFCCGLRVISMDGSTTDMPDSAENGAFFGRPSTAGRDGAFPQVRWVTAAESGTGALTGASFGRYGTGEQTLALDLLPSFGPGMLVLADRNFLSWSLARAVLATGPHILWRASASFTLKPVTALADGTCLAELKPPRTSDGPPATVRVIEYTVHTRAEGDGTEESSEVFCLVTSLLDIEEYPALDLACCYLDRWGCETVIGHLRQTWARVSLQLPAAAGAVALGLDGVVADDPPPAGVTGEFHLLDPQVGANLLVAALPGHRLGRFGGPFAHLDAADVAAVGPCAGRPCSPARRTPNR